MKKKDCIESGDELINTYQESSNYDESEISGDEESNQNFAFNSNGDMLVYNDLIEAERLESALTEVLPPASTSNEIVQTISTLENISNNINYPYHLGIWLIFLFNKISRLFNFFISLIKTVGLQMIKIFRQLVRLFSVHPLLMF